MVVVVVVVDVDVVDVHTPSEQLAGRRRRTDTPRGPAAIEQAMKQAAGREGKDDERE